MLGHRSGGSSTAAARAAPASPSRSATLASLSSRGWESNFHAPCLFWMENHG
jgi:hypothetical protein